MSTITEIKASRRAPKPVNAKPKGKAPSPAPEAGSGAPASQPDPVETSKKLAKAKTKASDNATGYDPTLETAHELKVGTRTVERAVQSLKQYAEMIGAPVDSHALLIIGKGAVMLPPLRKVYDKAASLLGIEPGSGGYSDTDAKRIREFYNATKSAQVKYQRNHAVADSTRLGWRGVKLVSGAEKYSAHETYSIKPVGKGAEVMTEARLATSALTLATARKMMASPEAVIACKQLSLFSCWQKDIAARAKSGKTLFTATKHWPEWIKGKHDNDLAIEAMKQSGKAGLATFKMLAKKALPPVESEE